METLLLPVLLIAVFYFLLIRPQQRQRKKTAEMQAGVALGARVMTGAGLLGTIVAIEDDEVVLEVAPGVTNRYVRRAIVNVLPTTTPSASGPDDTIRNALDEPADLSKEDHTNGDDTKR